MKVCVLKDCNKKHKALGFCRTHYWYFVSKQVYEIRYPKVKINYSKLKEEYKPTKFNFDKGEYKKLTMS